ncbi:MAG: S8 family serine peptidase [Anaerolineae bacterium]|nr:S8 family serine peptidase [Anaerolineae bacterium]
MTGKVLHRELVLDTKGKGQLIYEVMIEGQTGAIAKGNKLDELLVEEAQAYRARYERLVLELAAHGKKTAIENLQVVNDMVVHYPLTDRMCWWVRVLDSKSLLTQDVTIDLYGKRVDVKALEKAEFEARRAKYGRLEPELYYLLQTRKDKDLVKVLLWVKGVDYAGVDAQLVQKYPQLKGFRVIGGRVCDERGAPAKLDRELSRKVLADYNDLLDKAHLAAAQPIIDLLRARGYEAKALEFIPAVVAELSRKAVLELNEAPLENLGAIYWGEMEIHPQLDSAAPTVRATTVWGRGYTGEGVTIAVAEGGVINPGITHGALQGKIIAVNTAEATDWHAAAVAGVLAGDHPDYPQYRGIAYGSDSLVSARVTGGTIDYLADGLEWAVDQGAYAINCSFTTEGSRYMQPEDRALDYVARYRYPTIVVGAGNDVAQVWHVSSPAKGYNILTVGGFDDHNDSSWSDDVMWDDSCYVDPYIDGTSGSGDREKPDVVAVGASVTTAYTPWGDDGFRALSGTSLAAPQVTGLVALIMDRKPDLGIWPETIRAIVMASAINNIEGDSKLSDQDGAGGIDISLADTITANWQWATRNIVYPDDYEDDWLKETFTFSATAGDRVRVVICWDSNPSSDFQTEGSDGLDTDLILYVLDPELVGYSASLHNSFEIAEFTATKTGQYTIRILRDPATSTETSNYLGVAWAKVAYNASYPSQSTPGAMLTGSTNNYVDVTVKNTGSLYWPSGGGNPVRLGYHWYDQNYNPVSGWADYRTYLPYSMGYGQEAGLHARVGAPSGVPDGIYILQWDVVREGITWFADQGVETLDVPVLVADEIHSVYLPVVMKNYQ